MGTNRWIKGALLSMAILRRDCFLPKCQLIFSSKMDAGKVKTRKSSSKRFNVTGSGKIIRRQCGKVHLNEKKKASRKENLSCYQEVAKSDMANVLKCLPYL